MQKTFNRTKSIRQLVDNLSYPEYVKTRAEIHALNPEKIGLFAEVYTTYLYSMKPEIFKSKEALNKFLSNFGKLEVSSFPLIISSKVKPL